MLKNILGTQWLFKHKRNRLYTHIHVCAQHNTYTYIQLQHFPISLCNVPLVVYANVQKITKLYLKNIITLLFWPFALHVFLSFLVVEYQLDPVHIREINYISLQYRNTYFKLMKKLGHSRVRPRFLLVRQLVQRRQIWNWFSRREQSQEVGR